MMFRHVLAASAALACTLLSQPQTAAAAQEPQLITLLDKGEPYEAMLFEGNVLWVGKSRKQFNANYSMEAYSSSGELLASVALPHSVSNMKPNGLGGIVINGINPNTRLTNYTTLSYANRKISAKTTEIALGGFITFWVGQLNGRNYFVDQGGNPDDNELQKPAQTIFYANTTRARYLSTRVRMPINGHIVNNKLYLHSSAGIGSFSGKFVEVDPSTESVKTIYGSDTADLTGFALLPSKKAVATAARADQKLLVVDLASGRALREFPIDGYTRSVVTAGHCVFSGNDESNTVMAFDLDNAESSTPVAQYNVKLPAEDFSGVKSVAIDPATGNTFVRATIACNPMIDPCTNDNNRVISLGSEFAAQIKGKCFN